MAQNNTFCQEKLQALIDKEKQIETLLDQVHQEADQKIASAQEKAGEIKTKAREEAEQQAHKTVAEASSLKKSTGKGSGNIPLTENPPDQAFERAAQLLVDMVTGREEG